MVDWPPSGGLLLGAEAHIAANQIDMLRDLFDHLEITWSGQRVHQPGRELWAAIEKEDLRGIPLQQEFRTEYQRKLAEILSALAASSEYVVRCCDFHQRRYQLILDAYNRGDRGWLADLLEIVSATTPDLHFQAISSLECKSDTILSRFMPLWAFARNHTTSGDTAAALTRLKDRLSPMLGQATRTKSRKTGELGTWHGRIGSYPGVAGHLSKYTVWCEMIKPFCTLSESIDERKRLGSPDEVLRALGVPFEAGQYWIELIYNADIAGIIRPSDHLKRVGVPTHVECAGNWAFRPDREASMRHNFSRNIGDGSRGLPEIVASSLNQVG